MRNLSGDEFGFADLDGHLARTRQYTLGDLLRKGARTVPSKVALQDDRGTERTYREYDNRVNAFANTLVDRGHTSGNRIAILSENRAEYGEVLFAGAKTGMLVGTLNWRLEREELLHCVEVIDADVLVVSAQYQKRLSWITDESFSPDDIIVLDEQNVGTDYESLIDQGSKADPDPATPPTSEDGAVVIYSSGTTGMPKALVLSHRALLFRAIMWASNLRSVASGPDELVWSPLFHAGGLHPVLGGTLRRGTVYLIDGMQPERVLEEAATLTDANRLAVHPGTIRRILKTAENLGYSTEDFEHIEYLHGITDLTHPEAMRDVTNFFGADWANGFGCSEVGGVLGNSLIPEGTVPDKEDFAKREAPLCQVKLIDEDWNEVPDGEVGEVSYRGPTMFTGYLGNQEANREVFNDGWFRAGDLMIRDERRRYHFLSRTKYLIKSGGENIYPAEIERKLIEHPAVTEACVVRTPDEKWGEVPKLYVAVSGNSTTRKELMEFLKGKIARYKLPHYIEFVDEDAFPRSTTGEIVRVDVEDWDVTHDERIRNP